MGNEQSSGIDGELYNPDEFIFLNQTNDGRYGEIKVLRNKLSNQFYCEVNRTLNSEQAFEKHKERAYQRKELNHQNIVKLYNFTALRKEEFCSSFWKISFLYEYVDNDLKREIEKRSKSNIPYAEGDLWYVLQCAVDSLLYLQSKKASHGDVRPQNILISRDGIIKFSENFQFNRQLSAYQQVVMGIREEIYLSPELYLQLKTKNQDAKPDDLAKNEVFALGLSLLEAATLKSTFGIYDGETFTIKTQALDSLLELVYQNYGQIFYSILRQLLELEGPKRPTFEQIDQQLKQFKQEQWWSQIVPTSIQLVEESQQAPVDQEQKNPESQSQTPSKPEPINQRVDNFEPTEVFVPEKYIQQSVSKSPQANFQQEQSQQKTSYSASIKQSPQVIHQEFIPVPSYVQTTYNPPIQQTTTNFQYETFSQPIDYSDLDARINAVLAMSRETVMKYGGNKVLEEYERAHQQIPTTSYLNYEKYQPSTAIENRTYNISSNTYDIPSKYKVIEEKSYQTKIEPSSSYTTSYLKNIDTGYQRIDDYTSYKLSDQVSSTNTGYTDIYKPSIISTQNYGYTKPDYAIPQYLPSSNEYQKISYQNVSESINLKRSSVGSKDYIPGIAGTTAQAINTTYQNPYTQNGSSALNQSSSTANLEAKKVIQTTTTNTTQDVPSQYNLQSFSQQSSQQQSSQQQQLNTSRRESPYKPAAQYLGSETVQSSQQSQQQQQSSQQKQQINDQVTRTTNNYQNYSDLDLDAEIQKSLKRSKEVELLVSSTRKTLASQQNYQ